MVTWTFGARVDVTERTFKISGQPFLRVGGHLQTLWSKRYE